MHEEKPDKKSENTQPDSIERTVQIELNNRRNYGVTYQMVSGRMGDKRLLDAAATERMHIGTWNITPPHQLYSSMNPHEILALFFGIGDIKSCRRLIRFNRLLEEAGPNNIYPVIDEAINKSAWGEYGIPTYLGLLKKRRYNPHDHNAGMLAARIALLSNETKAEFWQSFIRWPQELGLDFFDPGRDCRGNPIDAYARSAYRYIRSSYELNIRKQNQAASDSPQSKNT